MQAGDEGRSKVVPVAVQVLVQQLAGLPAQLGGHRGELLDILRAAVSPEPTYPRARWMPGPLADLFVESENLSALCPVFPIARAAGMPVAIRPATVLGKECEGLAQTALAAALPSVMGRARIRKLHRHEIGTASPDPQAVPIKVDSRCRSVAHPS